MRVIAGEFRSRRLKSIPGDATRPTPDRLRETLFDILGPRVAGVTFLDAYAGTGAVGIEALSRGAKQVYFVENADPAAKFIEQNLERLGIGEGYKILRQDLVDVLWRLRRERVAADVVFLDPPYRMRDAYERSLKALADSSLVWAMTLVIAEHEKKFDPGADFGSLRRIRKLVQGDSALSFYRIGGQPDLSR